MLANKLSYVYESDLNVKRLNKNLSDNVSAFLS